VLAGELKARARWREHVVVGGESLEIQSTSGGLAASVAVPRLARAWRGERGEA